MRGRKNPPLDLTPVPDDGPLTFDTMAHAYLEDYVLQRYRTLSTARPRVEHLREFFGGWTAEAITADRVRDYQLGHRKQGAEAATIDRETSALSRMFQLAIRRGRLARSPLFPNRLEENPPRNGLFEHDEYLRVRAHLPASYQDVLDFAYYSGWRRNEILGLTWDEGGPGWRRDSATAQPIEDQGRSGAPDLPATATRAGTRRRARRPGDPRVFRRDGVTVRAWHYALRDAWRKAQPPHRLLHDCGPHGRAQPNPSGRPRADRHAAHGAQDPGGLRSVQHRQTNRNSSQPDSDWRPTSTKTRRPASKSSP